MALGVGATALRQLDDRPPWLIWNASASVPIGLYAVAKIIGVHAGDLVVVRPPEPLARFLADRGYLPRGVPLLKHVAALAGQSVCRIGRSITVDAIEMGDALERDSRGRALPSLAGLPRRRPGRSLPDEPAVRRLARRTLFRPAAHRLDRRPRDPSLGQSNRRGGMIVQPSGESVAITLSDDRADHSVISAGSCTSVMRTIAPRWQPNRRVERSTTCDATAPARSPSLHLVICAAGMFFSSGAPFDGSARAEPAAITGSASSPAALPFTVFVARGLAEIQYLCELDSGGHAH